MKIGSLYGISAPMMVLFSNELSSFDLKRFMYPVCNVVDSSVIEDARTELLFFKSALNELPMSYITMSDTLWVQQHADVKIKKLVSSDGSDDTVKRVKRELSLAVALQLFKMNDVPKDALNCDNIQEYIATIVNDFMKNNQVRVSKLKIAALDVIDYATEKSGAAPNQEVFKNKIQKAYPLKKALDARALGLDQEEAKVVQYFVDNVSVVDDLIEQLKITSFQEETFFDSAFSDIINRKPSNILYRIIKKFDQIKTKQGSRFFNRVYDDVSSDFQAFVKVFRERVSSNAVLSSDVILTPAKAMEIEQRFSASNSDFFKALFKKGLDYNDLTVEIYTILNEILSVVESADYKFLNSSFGTNFSKEDWEQLFEKLCDCGVGGLNVSGVSLFRDSISTVSFCGATNVHRDRETCEEFEKNIKLIQELLESMIIPIGGDISERSALV